MKNKKIIFFLGVTVLLIIGLYFFIYTTAGSSIVANRMISKYIAHDEMMINNFDGNLGDGLIFENLELMGVKGLPEGSTVRIQKIYVELTSFNINGLYAKFENIRVRLPDANPIVIDGFFKEQQLDFNIYSKGFTITEIVEFLPDFKKLVPLKGDVNDIDLYITGNYLEPLVKGDFTVDRFVYKGFLLSQAPLNIDLQIKDIKRDIKLHGRVSLAKGQLQTKRTLVVLGEGDLKFSGLWDKPQINLKGISKVDKTEIDITLRGSIDKPELLLSSDPSYSREKLMVMLATGKSWTGVEDSFNNGLNSAAVTRDFIDYFFFAGRSNQFAKRFGISEFSVTYDDTKKGISAKKTLTDKLEVGYGIEQSNNPDDQTGITQKIEGEYKINKKLSIGVEREMQEKRRDAVNDLLDEQVNENNDKLLIKYKKSF